MIVDFKSTRLQTPRLRVEGRLVFVLAIIFGMPNSSASAIDNLYAASSSSELIGGTDCFSPGCAERPVSIVIIKIHYPLYINKIIILVKNL